MSLISSILAVVKTTAATFVPGVKSFEEAGEAVIDLVKTVRPTLASDDQNALDAALPELLAKMNRDVDKAIADLRG